jgi:hypothetical protein
MWAFVPQLLLVQSELSTEPSPGWRAGCARRSSNWTSFSSRLSSPRLRACDGHDFVDLAVGCPALHYAEENPDEVLAALDDKTEAVIASSKPSTLPSGAR